MEKSFNIGDHVSWNSEAGRITGTIIEIHHSDFEFKGITHRASKDKEQYEVRSDKTSHTAAHKTSALRKLKNNS